MRVVLDTNVLLRAVISPQGPAAELLEKVAVEGGLVLSLAILSELYDVLKRPQIRKLHGLSEARIRRAVSRLYKLAIVVPVPPDIPQVVPHDPKDDPIVMTAIAGKASALCTLDKHLFKQPVVDFCNAHNIHILNDVALLTELKGN